MNDKLTTPANTGLTQLQSDVSLPKQHANGHSNLKKIYSKILTMLGFRKATLKESLEEVLEEHEESEDQLNEEEKDMLRKVLAFREIAVENVMIPRSDIAAVPHDIDLDGLKKIIAEQAHTRMPVYKNTLDDIVGFLHIKDVLSLLSEGKAFDMPSILRHTLFVPPSMKINALLVKMQFSHVHIAIVVDEYGGTSGLVTMEDLVEEIVGEIEDEHDVEEEDMFIRLSQHMYEASGRISISDLEEKIDMRLKEDNTEDFDTLGGLIFFILGRIPSRGEVASHPSGVEFEVIDADARRIKRVLIRKH